MSLAMIVDAGRGDATVRLTAAVGSLMTAALVLAAWEQWHDGLAARHWLLTLACALGCAGWCLVLARRGRRRSPLAIHVAADGRLRLVKSSDGESVEAAPVMAWGLGCWIYLRVKPDIKVDPALPAGDEQQSQSAFGSGDCRFLLARRAFSQSDWHGLRRWLVWYRRSVHGEAAIV